MEGKHYELYIIDIKCVLWERILEVYMTCIHGKKGVRDSESEEEGWRKNTIIGIV